MLHISVEIDLACSSAAVVLIRQVLHKGNSPMDYVLVCLCVNSALPSGRSEQGLHGFMDLAILRSVLITISGGKLDLA